MLRLALLPEGFRLRVVWLLRPSGTDGLSLPWVKDVPRETLELDIRTIINYGH